MAVAVGLYFLLEPYVGKDQVGWMCILNAVPFAACGFFQYHGMSAEQTLWAWYKSEVRYPKRLVFRSDCLYYRVLQPAMEAGKKPRKKPRRRKEKAGDAQ